MSPTASREVRPAGIPPAAARAPSAAWPELTLGARGAHRLGRRGEDAQDPEALAAAAPLPGAPSSTERDSTCSASSSGSHQVGLSWRGEKVFSA